MLPSGSIHVKVARLGRFGLNCATVDFAGFTLTQFRHSYIPVGQTAAASRLEPGLIGGPIIGVSFLWRVVLYSPARKVF